MLYYLTRILGPHIFVKIFFLENICKINKTIYIIIKKMIFICSIISMIFCLSRFEEFVNCLMYKTNSTCSMLIGIASNECVAVKVSKKPQKMFPI